MSKHIVICTPAYDGNLSHGYLLSYLELKDKLEKRGISLGILFTVRESLVTRARNYLCHDFLNSNGTHMLFIDSDIQFNVDDIIKMIDVDVDVIGGVYPKKTISWQDGVGEIMDYVLVPLKGKLMVRNIYEPQEVHSVGTGMMLIKRCVLEEMAEAYPNDTYVINDIRYMKYFDCAIIDDQYYSEDYYFCHRWRAMGKKVYAAYWTKCTHWGLFGYKGDVEDYARRLAAN